jgi:LmbE family N-acetylglucosaminyl deacetylase
MAQHKKILVAAPHADDEIIGLGGTLLKWRSEGHAIKLVLFACSDIYMMHTSNVVTRDVRAEEFRKSAAILSSEPYEILDLPDSQLDGVLIGDIIQKLDHILIDFDPDTVIYPEPSYHQDHQVVNRACTAALRPTRRSRPSQILTYEIPTSGWVGSHAPFIPNWYIDISAQIAQKLQIFEDVYKSQFSDAARCRLARDGIYNHARYRGYECGVEAAEAFRLLYSVET